MTRMAPQHQQHKGTDDLLLGDSQIHTAEDVSEPLADDPPYLRDRFQQQHKVPRQSDTSEAARLIMQQLEERSENEDEETNTSKDSNVSSKKGFHHHEFNQTVQGANKWKWVIESTLVVLGSLVTVATFVVLSGVQDNNQATQVSFIPSY